jgi:ABC-2 type transport system permease protein
VKALIRAELFKQHSTRTGLELLVWMIGVVSFVVLLHVFALHADTISSRDGQLKVVGWGTSIGALFASLLGAMSITSELRHGTIRPTFLATPRRMRVLVAKVVTSALAGVAIGLLAQALAAGIASAGLAERGIDISLGGREYVQLLAGGALAGGLWGAIGVGIGAVVRSQVGSLIGLCVWLLLIETALIGNVASVGKFAPGAGAGALAGAIQTQSATALLSPALGGLLLAAYATAVVAAGSLTLARSDVT